MKGARRLQAETKVRKLGSSRMQETELVEPKLGRSEPGVSLSRRDFGGSRQDEGRRELRIFRLRRRKLGGSRL